MLNLVAFLILLSIYSIRFPRVNSIIEIVIINAFFSFFKYKITLHKKFFNQLRIIYLFIKYFIDLFVDITLTFSDSSFNSF